MNCNEVQEKLSLYIDGMLPASEMSQIREHLLLCPECNREYLLLTEITELLHTTELPELPAGFDAELRQRLEEEGSNKVTDLSAKRKQYRKIGAIAACLLICVVSVSAALLHNLDLDTENVSDMNSKPENLSRAVVSSQGGIQDTTEPNAADDTGMLQDDNKADQEKQKKSADGNSASGGVTEGDTASDTAQPDAAKNETASNYTMITDPAAGNQVQNPQQPISGGAGGNSKTALNENAATQDGVDSGVPEAANAMPYARSAPGGLSGSSITGSSDSNVMQAAYNAGAQTYNDALDFVSLIADNDMDGLIDWIMLHSAETITKERASELAAAYMEKYKTNAD